VSIATRGLGFPPQARRRAVAKPRRQARRVRVVARVQPESVLLAQVRSLAALYGWRCYHTFDSRRSEPGYPDVTLVRGDRLIFAELKTQRGRLTTVQIEWIELLRLTCAEVYVWRPADLQLIAAILRRRN
jgi:hypothetical protein